MGFSEISKLALQRLPAYMAYLNSLPKDAPTHISATTIATALGEDPGTIEEVYEPYLIKEGFLKRTPRGREVTPLAYEHLGSQRPDHTLGLFG